MTCTSHHSVRTGGRTTRGAAEEKAPQGVSLQGSLFTQSGRRDLNPRPPEPHSGALPGCATSRKSRRQALDVSFLVRGLNLPTPYSLALPKLAPLHSRHSPLRSMETRVMSGVRVLVGTRKGAFLLTADGKRKRWTVSGPHFAGWEIYHLKGSPADPNRIYGS